MITIELDPQTEKRLADLSKRTGQSPQSCVLEAIEQHLEELEDGYVAQERLREPGTTYSAEEVKRELDL